ncbi:MAG: hypothetical protein PHD25_01060 [Bacteroidales bacterium]|nr:hypothetical protein [Bacteroidales bacterium]
MERLDLATGVVFLEPDEVVAGTVAIPGLNRDGCPDVFSSRY